MGVNHGIVYFFPNFIQIIFVAFIFVICVILMNLFVGLIVGDVDAINRVAETKQWKMNVDFIKYNGTIHSTHAYEKVFTLCCINFRSRDESNGIDVSSNETLALLFVS